MSIVFVPKKLRGKAKINQETIQRLLDENDQLVRCIAEYMQKGRAVECVHPLRPSSPIRYQQILHRNIVYLATIADASPDNMHPSTSSTSNEASASTPAANGQGAT
ncbi:SS18-like protein 2 isoform 1-T1 [Spinachia spinachia]